MQALFRHIIGGLCYWYVDDLMAVSPKALYVNNNSSLVNSNVQQLLGVALAKSQHDRLSALAQSDIMMWRAFALLLITNPSSYRHAAAKAKETLRINSLKLLHLDSQNDQSIQESLEQVLILRPIRVNCKIVKRFTICIFFTVKIDFLLV